MIAKNKFTKAHQIKQAIQQLIGGGGAKKPKFSFYFEIKTTISKI